MGWCFVALSLLVFVDGVLADGFGFDEGLFELGVVGGGGIGGGDRPDGVLFFVEGADVPVVGGEGPYFLVGGFGGGRPGGCGAGALKIHSKYIIDTLRWSYESVIDLNEKLIKIAFDKNQLKFPEL